MAAMGGGAGGGGRGPRDMRLTMQEAAKKLSLWDSATFRPILTHVELEPILAAAGFAFLGAVEFYLGALRVASLFHVRCMPVTTAQDRVFDKVFRVMRSHGVEDDGLIVYRDGTLDDATYAVCSEHSPVQDVGYHVIPGNTCVELGYLKSGRIAGNCDEETCCRGGAAAADIARARKLEPQ
uniref:Uncharacterized protein n=1 Tax=Oryza barthii TaxID=65489 RepID=A0A0D3H226_9ORYZ